MKKKSLVAKMISEMFSPQYLMALYIGFLLLSLGIPVLSWEMLYIAIEVVFYFYVIPSMPVLYYIKRGIDPNYVSGRERVPILFGAFIGYSLAYLHFYYAKRLIFLGFAALMIVFMFLFTIGSLFSKPSIHVGALTSGIIYLALIIDIRILCAMIFVPIVAWSRITLKAHTFRQTIYGLILGAISGILGTVFPLYLKMILEKYSITTGAWYHFIGGGL